MNNVSSLRKHGDPPAFVVTKGNTRDARTERPQRIRPGSVLAVACRDDEGNETAKAKSRNGTSPAKQLLHDVVQRIAILLARGILRRRIRRAAEQALAQALAQFLELCVGRLGVVENAGDIG